MSEEFKNITDRQTDRHTELLPELLVGAKNDVFRQLWQKMKKADYA